MSQGGGGTGGSTGAGGGATTTTSGTNTSAFSACTGPGQCILMQPSCCSGCSTLELGSVVAVNEALAQEYFNFVCPDPVPCPECEPLPNPNLFAYCDNGQCVAADVRKEDFSKCASDADCALRATSGCCQPCSATAFEMIATQPGAEETLKSLVCAPDEGCSKCLPQYPPQVSAVCAANGHCAVAGIGP